MVGLRAIFMAPRVGYLLMHFETSDLNNGLYKDFLN